MSPGRFGVTATSLAVALSLLLLPGCGSGAKQQTRAAGGTAGSALPSLARHAAGPAYYLALGDSLSVGLQPGPDGRGVTTGQGYPRQLAAMLSQRVPRLQLAELGCSGETSSTMIRGATCHYPAGSQLAQAVEFLRAHRGHVVLVTIDIGANDPNSCVLGARLSALPGCLSANATRTQRNLATILARLRAAAGPRVLIVGMNYYVPELALWLSGKTGAELAVVSERLASGFGELLTAEYRRFGGRVADVFAAFGSADFTGWLQTGHFARLPHNVAAICKLTWMCASPPVGPNEHANTAGYRVIAMAFWRAITS